MENANITYAKLVDGERAVAEKEDGEEFALGELAVWRAHATRELAAFGEVGGLAGAIVAVANERVGVGGATRRGAHGSPIDERESVALVGVDGARGYFGNRSGGGGIAAQWQLVHLVGEDGVEHELLLEAIVGVALMLLLLLLVRLQLLLGVRRVKHARRDAAQPHLLEVGHALHLVDRVLLFVGDEAC